MRNSLYFLILVAAFAFTFSFTCGSPEINSEEIAKEDISASTDDFVWQTETFADIGILRYQVPGFDLLNLDQKKLVYYLTQAGLAGRDIIYDQNYRHNLAIRKALESIIKNYKGDRNSKEWNGLVTYAKRVWFANGIHHHYSNDKFTPGFSQDYMLTLLKDSNSSLSTEALDAIFNNVTDNKKVNLDPAKGLVKGSATNFYDPDITEAEVDAYYSTNGDDSAQPLSIGLNSKVIRGKDGKLTEQVYSAKGMYADAIKEVVKWLEKAVAVAENKEQGDALKLLIEYYQTGDLKKWDDYNIAWVEATKGDIDYINGFIEVYNDPKGYKGSYESIVEITDFEASAQMKVLADNAQWFEDNSTIEDKHKKENVVGVSYKVVTVAGEAGDASPATPIGVNLPNANWIRAEHGSKSVSLGNIISAYGKASGPGMLKEFAYDEKEVERTEKYGSKADKLATALHEVIGHASGKMEEGVGTPKQTLKSYASTLEEARADIVALYFIMDTKIVELGLIPTLDAAKAEYDSYISNGLMKQLQRIELGKDIEESHMRNRQMIAAWAFEKGQDEKVIEKVNRNGKTYFKINDYEKLRAIFGNLLRKLQRIKSQGDYEAGKNLVENYGVKVDEAIHKEVLDRVKDLNIPPYRGFINPVLVPVEDQEGNITDIKVTYPEDFMEQMLYYAEKYSFLPTYN
jgi:dipeptidyl-peptidase III